MYFAKQIAHSYRLKNNLQVDFREMCLSKDNTMIYNQFALDNWINSLYEELLDLEKKHPRSKPISARWREDSIGADGYEKDAKFIGVSGIGLFAIYEVKYIVE